MLLIKWQWKWHSFCGSVRSEILSGIVILSPSSPSSPPQSSTISIYNSYKIRRADNEANCAAMTPPGFYFKSLPRQSGTGGGLAVLHRSSLTKNIAVSTRNFVFMAFEICEVHLSNDGHTAVFLSVYRPPPSRQNKLANAMFLEQFSDLLESCFFVIGFCSRRS